MGHINERPGGTSPVRDASPPNSDITIDEVHEELDGLDGDKDREKRTRRRFATAQLTLLEQLYHRSSHPTREQREEVASQGNM